LEPRAVPAKTNEREWDEACRRDDHIRALLEQFPKGRIGKAAICATAGALGVATATLYRLIRRFRKEQRVSALLPGKRGRPVGTLAIPESVENIIQESIKKIYLVPERPSLKELTRYVAARCHACGEQPPSERTIKTRVNRIDPLRRARLRQDDREVEAMTATPGKLVLERPLELVQIDHTLTDIVVVDEETRQFVGRPWLTIGIDVFSRMVTGFSLSFDPPQRASVGLCLLHSVYDKTAWLQSMGIDIPWPVAGLPRRIGVDNAAEFRSRDFRAACREFGIKLEYRPLGKNTSAAISSASSARRWAPFNFYLERRSG
jgi:putative transposase